MPTNLIDSSTGFFTDAVASAMLASWHRGVPATPPSARYLGLSAAPASRSGSVSEPPSGSGYARVALPTPGSFEGAERGKMPSVATFSFAPTADWPDPVVSCFIADAPTGGTVLWAANLTAPRTVTLAGGPVSFALGALVVVH